MLTVNVYIIVIYDVITVDYCKCIVLYSPLNSYLLYSIGYWTLNKYYYYYNYYYYESLSTYFMHKYHYDQLTWLCIRDNK